MVKKSFLDKYLEEKAYMDEEEESLLLAIRRKNQKAIDNYEKAVEKGQVIRII